jgi:hypothetical protein
VAAQSQQPEKAVINGKTAPPLRPPTLPQEPSAGGSDPRSMVPVRLAGAEVSEGFCTKLAVLF